MGAQDKKMAMLEACFERTSPPCLDLFLFPESEHALEVFAIGLMNVFKGVFRENVQKWFFASSPG